MGEHNQEMKYTEEFRDEMPKTLSEFVTYLKKKSQTSEFKYLIDFTHRKC